MHVFVAKIPRRVDIESFMPFQKLPETNQEIRVPQGDAH
jgi:hypothetical protein